MNLSNDRRLCGQETYLLRVRLIRQSWQPANPENDHDHCAFCWGKFMHHEGCLKSGYSTLNRQHWICESCFREFRADFDWEVVENA